MPPNESQRSHRQPNGDRRPVRAHVGLWPGVLLGGVTAFVAACGGSSNAGSSATDAAVSSAQAAQGTVFAATVDAAVPTPGSPLPGQTPSATSAPSGTPPPLTIQSVTGGQRTQNATVMVLTAPATSCSIEYRHPSGKVSTTRGLNPHQSDASGVISWTFRIDSTTQPGTGTITVMCGTAVAHDLIHIS